MNFSGRGVLGATVLRIVFTTDDLARVRVAPQVDPLWEVVLSLHHLQTRPDELVFGRWLNDVRGRLRHRTEHAAARVLSTLAPADSYFPDFLTPAGSYAGFEDELDAVLCTPQQRVRHDLGRLAARRRVPSWVGRLASADSAAMHHLGNAFRAYYRTAVHPHQRRIEAAVGADRARRTQAMSRGGTEALLGSLGPAMRWRSPVLEVDYPSDRVLDLAGRGLDLVPSYFCWRMPVALADPSLPPTVVYPVLHPSHAVERPSRGSLAALVGPTRAAVLAVIGAGASTSQIARRLAISPATASHHATVLRNAGLTSSERRASEVLHALTPLGESLLAGTADDLGS